MGNAPLNFFPWPSRYIVAPGDAFDIITAGGVKRDSSPWRSQTSATGLGPTFDGRIKPDLVALADAVTIVNPDDSSEYLASSGTSCATALIAGICALILEAHPNWNADSVKQALFSTASLSVPNCTLGFGIPNVDSVLKVYPSRIPTFQKNTLAAPYPVPFVLGTNEKIYFPFYLMNTPRWAELRIYSLSGDLIKKIELAPQDINVPGRYIDYQTLNRIGAYWDGKNAAGEFCASGIYFVVFESSFGSDRKIFALVR
ncbi:MAG: S8 family serine peptidase [candidate division WOR-3 bacterium]|nr:S8 family serine peptidase [candidate division WOR-3 bacterium]